MIVAVGFGNCDGDTPSVFIVDTVLCTEAWRKAIFAEVEGRPLTEIPDEWKSLEQAKVTLPVVVEAAVFIYYAG